LFVFGLALSGCGSDDDSDSADDGTTTTGGDSSDSEPTGDSEAVAVSLSEWDIEVPADIAGGSVTIAATNDGGETHELVIVRADSVDGWEQEEGKVLEDQFAEEDFIGEIEEFDAGTTETATFELDPGTYVFFCNIVEEEEDGELESHFDEGMWTVVNVS
jgi:plastocyanin